ncbi:MAG: hypothetical protein Q8N83_03665 [Ignavibacteria bacterium]|nr:hypothetical protein [Ignavibacteria bacterium]
MKYEYIKTIAALFVIFFLVQGCNKNEEIVKYVTTEKQGGYITLSETKVEIGQKITAHFINMDSVQVYSVTLNQTLVTFQQLNDSTVTLIAPYTTVGNGAGNFVFYCTIPSTASGDTVLISSQINYKSEEVILNSLVKWNTNEKVSEVDSWKKDFNGENQGWSFQTDQDTIKLIRSYICHDECNKTETIVFLNNGNDSLPAFLFASFDKWELMKSPIHEIITSGSKIMIDEWRDSTNYSGTFTSANYCWIFWAKKNLE